jgi:UDP-glucose 4-epimerase
MSIKNKTILITGGTGSFGNALVDRLIPLKPKKIIIFSRDEKKQSDMRNKYNNDIIHYTIGDVRESIPMRGVDYVFHAAALKQVPACEFHPMEAIKTNILGGYNVIQSAIENKVKKVIFLSTDKAVYPINAYGMSKGLMEKVMLSYANEIDVCGVRYGNVLFSRGSVLPLFLNLIKENKPLTITNPKMTRFLMTLNDAVDLVLDTLNNGKRGHVYIKKSPACTVETLAKAMCEIFNYQKGYVITGIRIGEKMHETLIAGDVPFTSFNTKQLSIEEVKQLLLTLPEIQEVLIHPTN